MAILMFVMFIFFKFHGTILNKKRTKSMRSFRPSPTDPMIPLFIHKFSSGAKSSFNTILSHNMSSQNETNHVPHYEAYRPLSSGEDQRFIRDKIDDRTGHVYTKEDFLNGNDDWRDHYYAADDDYVRNPKCRRTSWHRLYHPTCNNFHEMDLLPLVKSFVAHGYYRDVWGVIYDSDGDLDVVLKSMRFEHKHKYDHYEFTRMDALVMERLTSSPRIVNIYGHCAVSIMTEAVIHEIEEVVVPGTGYITGKDRLNDEKDVDVRNKFTPAQKLNLALEMAEAIADLHGFEDGVIVHDDIQLAQFLRSKNGMLKLNDFNRAEIMLWNENSKSYCRYKNGEGYGNYRAPEEYKDDLLDEKIDVFSFGNNCYALLTGLWNFYENEDDSVVQEKLINKETAYIDDRYRTRSYAEGQLVNIIEKCWIYDPRKRIDIFQVVKILRRAVKENLKREFLSN